MVLWYSLGMPPEPGVGGGVMSMKQARGAG